ncbi:MAG: DNA-binding transcriptional regulator [Kiritimatiellia bacterium]
MLVDTASTWGRGIITGIQNYARKHGGWHLFVETRGMEEHVSLPRGWQGDGVIARVGNARLAGHLAGFGIPVVNVSGIELEGVDFPRVSNDVEEVGRLAVNYFLERGFRNFAYLSLRGLEYVARQRDAYIAAVEKAGHSCWTHGVKVHHGFQSPDWNLKIDQLAKWIQSLPKPVAILTWAGGREVIMACHQAGIRVPQEVALLTGSEDELLCEISPIPSSGVQAATLRIGHEAAALLERLMKGGKAPSEPMLVPPVGVVNRQSTDTLAITDKALIAALAYVDANPRKLIRVRDLARESGISRSVLERRFAAILGTTPASYLAQARLQRVQRLLADTDLPIAEIAENSGYGSPEYMTAVFRKECNTPCATAARSAGGDPFDLRHPTFEVRPYDTVITGGSGGGFGTFPTV